MAVVDKYVNAKVQAGGRDISGLAGYGEKVAAAIVTFEVAAGDDNGSKYRLLKGIPTQCRILSVKISNDAMTGSTDWDLGFYTTDDTTSVGFAPAGGAVLDADVLVNGADLSAGHTFASPLDGLTALDLPDHVKPIYELLGNTAFEKPASVDLVLTANTVGSDAGTVTVVVELLAPVI